MKELKGSKTEANLLAAFAGESQARNKYTYYASKAKKDGYEQIAELFTETANNEKEHAKLWFKLPHGGICSTPANTKEAREEGCTEMAALFEAVAKIEKEHEERYLKLAQNIEDGTVFERPDIVIWKCANCGHIHVGTSAPEVCPVCAHPKAYFQLKAENY